MTPEKAIDLVRKCVALSASPIEGEADQAARTACKLIREHQISIGVSERIVYVDRPMVVERVVYRDPPTAHRVVVQSVGNNIPRWVLMPSKYDGVCQKCGKPYKPEDPIWWKKGESVQCGKCGKPRDK